MPDATVVSLRDECKDLLKEAKLMEKVVMNSRDLGVHPGNRYGDGVVPAEVLGLITDIFGNGFLARWIFLAVDFLIQWSILTKCPFDQKLSRARQHQRITFTSLQIRGR